MGERRDHIKKTLGITEYPWSSDDDDAEAPGGSELQQHTEDDLGQPSVAGNPGTSGQQTISGASSSSDREHSRPPSLFWSIPSMNAQRAPTFTLHRRDEPLSLVSRQSQPPVGAAAGPADVRRILAFRNISRPAPRHDLDYRKRNAFLRRFNISYNRGLSNHNRYHMIHTKPSVTSEIAMRRAQAIAEMNFSNNNVQGYHDSLLRADMAEAMRSYHQPSTSRGFIEPPPLQPVGLAPPRDVMELGEQHQSDSHMENPTTSMQPINLSHPDDSFLEEDHMERELPTADERNDLAIEYENETPTEANETIPEAAGGGADDTVDGGEASMSLEEVVEIDLDTEPTPAAMPLQGQPTEEPDANTSAANDEVSVEPHLIRRKRESDDDNNALGTVKDFNQNLLRLLECPVCLEWMEPPIWQCRRGHLVCGRCRARLAACPVCRTAFSSVRNRAMEGVAEMLRYPCRHGCGRDLQLRRRSAHEASCVARRYRCPAPQCDTRPPLAHKDLAPHFQSKHMSMLKLGHTHSFSMRVNSEQHDNWIILALGQLFHLRVDVDIRTWGVVVYVAYIGPKCNADDFTYEVAVTGQHNSRKLVYTRATHCDLECSSLNMSRQDCFHLTLDQALNFLRVRNRNPEPAKYLHFSVYITRSVAGNDDESN